jgi:hypothetical protein
MAEEREKWLMPEWMEPFRRFIGNTGGNPIEELMNDHKTNSFNNIIRAGLIVSVDAQIALLHRLALAGLLRI